MVALFKNLMPTFLGELRRFFSALDLSRRLQLLVTTLEVIIEKIGTICFCFSPERYCVMFYREKERVRKVLLVAHGMTYSSLLI